jgi:hypothetical protein
VSTVTDDAVADPIRERRQQLVRAASDYSDGVTVAARNVARRELHELEWELFERLEGLAGTLRGQARTGNGAGTLGALADYVLALHDLVSDLAEEEAYQEPEPAGEVGAARPQREVGDGG